MSEPIAVLALRRKRDQIAATIAHYERLTREAEHDLAHVNAALRLFEVTGEASSDLPPYVDLNRLLKRGETTKICMDALATEGRSIPASLRSVSSGRRSLTEADKVLAQSIALRVVQTLRIRRDGTRSSASRRPKAFASGALRKGTGAPKNCLCPVDGYNSEL